MPEPSASEIEALLAAPPLIDVAPSERERVVRALSFQRFSPGEVLVREGAEDATGHLLVAGEVGVSVDGRLLRTLEAPEVIGLLSTLDRAPRSATVRALEPAASFALDASALEPLTREAPSLGPAINRALAAELRALHQEDERQRRSYREYMLSPNARMVSGRFETLPFEQLLFVAEAQPADIERVLPPEVRRAPGAGGRYLVMINFFEGGRSDVEAFEEVDLPYREITHFVPCLGPDRLPALFAPELYLDSYLMISLGREVFGFPKRYGAIHRRAKKLDLIVDGRLGLRAEWASEAPVETGVFLEQYLEAMTGLSGPPGGARLLGLGAKVFAKSGLADVVPPVRVLVHRVVPEVRAGFTAPHRVNSLVGIPFRMKQMRDFHRLDGPRLTVHDPGLLPGRARAAYRLVTAIEFGEAETVFDYTRGRGR